MIKWFLSLMRNNKLYQGSALKNQNPRIFLAEEETVH